MKGLDIRELPEAAALMRRYDRKFLCNEANLGDLFEDLDQSHWYVEVNGQRESLYTNDYFDSEDLVFYHAHRTGRIRRNKFRLRTYAANALRFWELKQKHPRGYQTKHRTEVAPEESGDLNHAQAAYDSLLKQAGGLVQASVQLRPSLRLEYQRQTLYNPLNGERLTVDRGLMATDGVHRLDFGTLVLVELKQARRQKHRLDEWSRTGRVQEGSFSKYYIGKRLMLSKDLQPDSAFFLRRTRIAEIPTISKKLCCI
ncbi:MAG: polyphosphate polymerase domain-containing protein [Bacteroidota bacterium]